MYADSAGRWEILSQPFLSFGPLATPAEILSRTLEAGIDFYSERVLSSLDAFADYITNDLTSEHPDLGRPGPVCPFIKGALQRNLLRLTACSLDEAGEDPLTFIMDQMRQEFQNSAGSGDFNGEEIYRSIVVLFPHLSTETGPDLIERVQKKLKFSFVDQGLMIGEFYSTCAAPGLHNPDFRPFQAPVLSLAIRYMTVFDTPFLIGDDQYIESFCRRFGESGRKRVDSFRRKMSGEGKRNDNNASRSPAGSRSETQSGDSKTQ